MTPYFFLDTSALVKLYHEENGTAELSELINRESPVIVISDITVIEMISAFSKKVRTREIDVPTFHEAIRAFEGDIVHFNIIKTEDQIKKRASELLKTAGLNRGLRTLDSLQLAAALVFSEVTPLKLFIASDKVILNTASHFGLNEMLV